jgi:hypothetical protein
MVRRMPPGQCGSSPAAALVNCGHGSANAFEAGRLPQPELRVEKPPAAFTGRLPRSFQQGGPAAPDAVNCGQGAI